MIAIEVQIDAVTGSRAKRVGIDPRQRVARALRVVDEAFGESGEPHRRRRHDRALQVRVARQRQRFARRAVEADASGLAADGRKFADLRLEPESRRDEDLVVAAAPGVHLAAGIAEPLGQARLDRAVAILVPFIEHESAAAKVVRKAFEFALQRGRLIAGQDADSLQAFDVGCAGDDVVEEEFAIEHDVVAGEELHDARVDGDAGFLPE